MKAGPGWPAHWPAATRARADLVYAAMLVDVLTTGDRARLREEIAAVRAAIVETFEAPSNPARTAQIIQFRPRAAAGEGGAT
jgi:hypothetical protein